MGEVGRAKLVDFCGINVFPLTPLDSTMSLKITSMWVLLVFTALDLAYGNPCEKSPPGRYCTKDLLGWYECKEKGQLIKKKIVHCSEGQRYESMSIEWEML